MKFGEIAIAQGFIEIKQLQDALQEQQDQHADWPIGRLLCQLGYLTENQLQKVLAIQAKSESGHKKLQELSEYFLHFRLLEQIGKGGKSVVYRAFDSKRQCEVALKLISSLDIRSFERETGAIRKLDHSCIIKIYDSGEVNGRCFLSMELVKGSTLRKLIRDYSRISIKRGVEIFCEICHGIVYAHKMGVLHRDLKPANIMVDSETGCSKIVDFSLAKHLSDTNLTCSGQYLGTAPYMSPEQAWGKVKEIDEQSDVYGLGTILYEIITSKPPFAGKDWVEVISQVRYRDPIFPRHFNAQIAKDLECICLKAMAKEKQHRYANATMLVQDVESFLKGKPIQVRVPGRFYRWKRYAKRNKWLVFMTLCISMMLAFLVTEVYSRYRSEKDRRWKIKNARSDFALVERTIEQGDRGKASALLAKFTRTYREFDTGIDDNRIQAIRRRISAEIKIWESFANIQDKGVANVETTYRQLQRLERQCLDLPKTYTLPWMKIYTALAKYSQKLKLWESSLYWSKAYRSRGEMQEKSDALFQLALIFMRSEQYLRAKASIEIFIQHYPDSHKRGLAFWYLAKCYEEFSQFDYALWCYRKAWDKQGIPEDKREETKALMDIFEKLLPEREFAIRQSDRAVLGNLDSDAQDEIVLYNSSWIDVYKFDGHSLHLATSMSFPDFQKRSAYVEIAIGDVDGDGSNELVCARKQCNGPGNLYIATLKKKLLIQKKVHLDFYPASIYIGDIDHDHMPEVLLGLTETTYPPSPLIYKYPQETFRPLDPSLMPSSDVNVIATCDLDGDRKNEVLIGLGPWKHLELRGYRYQEKTYHIIKRMDIGQVCRILQTDLDQNGKSELCLLNRLDRAYFSSEMLQKFHLRPPGIYIYSFEKDNWREKWRHTFPKASYVPKNVSQKTSSLFSLRSYRELELCHIIDSPVLAFTYLNTNTSGSRYLNFCWYKLATWYCHTYDIGKANWFVAGDIDGDGDSELLFQYGNMLKILGIDQTGYVPTMPSFLMKSPDRSGSSIAQQLAVAQDLMKMQLYREAENILCSLLSANSDSDSAYTGKAVVEILSCMEHRNADQEIIDKSSNFLSQYPLFADEILRFTAHALKKNYRWQEYYRLLCKWRELYASDSQTIEWLEEEIKRVEPLTRFHTVFMDNFEDPASWSQYHATTPLSFRWNVTPNIQCLRVIRTPSDPHCLWLPFYYDASAFTLRTDIRIERMDWGNSCSFGFCRKFPKRLPLISEPSISLNIGCQGQTQKLEYHLVVYCEKGKCLKLKLWEGVGKKQIFPNLSRWMTVEIQYIPKFSILHCKACWKDTGEVIAEQTLKPLACPLTEGKYWLCVLPNHDQYPQRLRAVCDFDNIEILSASYAFRPLADTENRSQARALHIARRYEKTEKLYHNLLLKNPKDHETRIFLGFLKLNQGDRNAANRIFSALYQTDPRQLINTLKRDTYALTIEQLQWFAEFWQQHAMENDAQAKEMAMWFSLSRVLENYDKGNIQEAEKELLNLLSSTPFVLAVALLKDDLNISRRMHLIEFCRTNSTIHKKRIFRFIRFLWLHRIWIEKN